MNSAYRHTGIELVTTSSDGQVITGIVIGSSPSGSGGSSPTIVPVTFPDQSSSRNIGDYITSGLNHGTGDASPSSQHTTSSRGLAPGLPKPASGITSLFTLCLAALVNIFI